MASTSSRLPKARTDNLIIKEISNETLVYDEENNQAHCLNNTAALVWKSCDGRTGLPTLQRKLEKELGEKVPEEMIWLAIDQLEENSLLQSRRAGPSFDSRRSRRELIRKLGMAAAVLPIITSIATRTAAQAASCRNVGQTCTGPGQGTCCNGLFCVGGVCQVNVP